MNATTATKQSIIATPAPQQIHSDDVVFFVKDLTATQSKRRHIMLDENKAEVPFEFNNAFTALLVPYRYAIRFAAIEGFDVRDSNNRQIRAVQTRQQTGFKLQADEVIAKLNELTQGALVRRANAAGGKFNKNHKVAELIAFLVSMDGIVPVDESVYQRLAGNEQSNEVVMLDGSPLPEGASLLEEETVED